MKSLYDSPWHHPFACWVFALSFAVALFLRRRDAAFFRAYFWSFTLEIAADALFTGGWSPLRSPSPTATVLSVVFVILGDFRFFLLVEFVLARKLTLGVWARALGLSLIIPIATAPLSAAEPRVLFLIYESSFVVLAVLVRLVLIPVRGRALTDDARSFLYMLVGFEIVQYMAWAIADIRILSGHDLGYLIRIVPNVLYYGGFLWFAWLALPKGLRGARV